MGFLDDLKKAANDAQQAVQRGVDNLQKPSAPPEPPPLDGAAPAPPPVGSAPPEFTTPAETQAAAPPAFEAPAAQASAPPAFEPPARAQAFAPPAFTAPADAPVASMPGSSTIPTAVPVTAPQQVDAPPSSLMPAAVDPFSPPPAAG